MPEMPFFLRKQGDVVAVYLRDLYRLLGLNDRHYPDLLRPRIEKLGLIEGTDFVTRIENRFATHLTSLETAVQILSTFSGFDLQQLKDAQAQVEAFLQTSGLSMVQPPISDRVGGSGEQGLLPLGQPGESFSQPLPADVGPDSQEPLLPIIVFVVDSTGGVPIYAKGSKGIVLGRDLWRLWNRGDERYFSDWFRYRITKFQLASGKHYLPFQEPVQGSSRPLVNYVVSIDAALLIAAGEPRKQGETLKADLTQIRQLLKRSGLPGKSKLSEFVGVILPASRPADSAGSILPPAAELSTIPAPSQSADLAALADRVQFLEGVMGQLLTILQGQAQQVMAIVKSADPMPPIPLRSQIRMLVNQQKTASGILQDELFAWIYQQLYYRYGISIRNQRHLDNETHLEACERLGYLDKLHAIVSSEEFKALSSKAAQSAEQ